MKKIRISLMALIVVTASTFSFTSFSEPGTTQRYICSIHNDTFGQRHGGGLTTDADFASCVDNVKYSPHFAEIEEEYSKGNITIQLKEQHIPENCATLDPFY